MVYLQVYLRKLNLELELKNKNFELAHKTIILLIVTDVKNTTLHTVTDDTVMFR